MAEIFNADEMKAWSPIASALCRLGERLRTEEGGAPDDMPRHTADLLRRWRLLPESVQRRGRELRILFERNGHPFAASLCGLLQIRYSLHHQAAWRGRLNRHRRNGGKPLEHRLARLDAGFTLYGAGRIGHEFLAWLRELGRNPLAMLDANSTLTEFEGVAVRRPEDLDPELRRHPVVITLADENRVIDRTLRDLGYATLLHRDEWLSHERNKT